MVDFNARCEFPPADTSLFTKWLGWVILPNHLNNDSDLLEREQWH